jgi:imidazolonepropionase-like amidohydrolase
VNVSGKAWHYPNRYGRLIGRTPPENGTLADAIIKETDRVDQVKIVNSGLNSLICFGKQTKPQFTLNELSNAVNAANRRCLPVMVHANGRAPVEIAINAGVRSIEHGFFMGKENLKKMADRRVFWVPTAFTMKAYAANLNATRIRTDVPKRNLDYQLEQIAVAKALGVPIALGTDAGSLGVDHGRGVIEELNLLIEAGFSIPEAVRCATLNGATLLGLNDSGRLTRNATATFIAVKGAPSELPESLSRIERVYLNGRFFDANFSRPSYPD